MKIVSWNVNGLRTRIVEVIDGEIKEEGSLYNLITQDDPDMICFQETRCSVEKAQIFKNNKYPYQYYNESKREGARGPNRYSGTSIWSKIKPEKIEYQIPNYQDNEGRIIIFSLGNQKIINVTICHDTLTYLIQQ